MIDLTPTMMAQAHVNTALELLGNDPPEVAQAVDELQVAEEILRENGGVVPTEAEMDAWRARYEKDPG